MIHKGCEIARNLLVSNQRKRQNSKEENTISIKVCDAIMGAGKTEAAITYMNEHKEKKFIYVKKK